MRRRTALIGLGMLPALKLRAQPEDGTPPAEVATELPGARLQGSATLTFLLLRVYDVRLWAAAPLGADYAQDALALELRYARALPGRDIAERSIAEMRGIGEFDPAQAQRWLQALLELLPDVQPGDRLTGVQRAPAARLHHNGVLRGEVIDADFTRLFFGIWLSPRSSQPQLREALLGGKGAAS